MLVDIVVPGVGESVTSGVLSRWLVADGSPVRRDDVVFELETDKATMEVRAPADGALKRLAADGDTVNVGAIVGKVDTSVAAPASTPAPEPKPAAKAPQPVTAGAPAPEPANGDARATPLARKLATEHGVDLAQVSPTGAGGRIREQDVLAFVESRKSTPPPATAQAASKPPAPSPKTRPAPIPGSRASTRERMSPLRQRIAQRLVHAQHTAAMLTTFNECDMSAVLALRKQYKEEFEKKHAIGLGFMGFFVKAAVAALRAFPTVNAYIVEEGGQGMIERHDFCDIAVAVSTPKGLVVPVVRNAEALSFAGIEAAIKDLATRARDGKLALEEMQGGTFTITNGGVFGSLLSTPILNPPQSAILGMHAIRQRPVEHPPGSGAIALRPMMNLALSYDHRIIDGSEAVQFLVAIRNAIEDPQRLLLEV